MIPGSEQWLDAARSPEYLIKKKGKVGGMADIYVEMIKVGKTIIVHPATVANHQQLGWTVVREGVPMNKGKAKKAEPEEAKESKPSIFNRG